MSLEWYLALYVSRNNFYVCSGESVIDVYDRKFFLYFRVVVFVFFFFFFFFGGGGCGAVKCAKTHKCANAPVCANISPTNVQTTTLCANISPTNVQICKKKKKKKIHQPQMCKHHAYKCANVQFWREMCKQHPTNVQIIVFIKNQFTSGAAPGCLLGGGIVKMTRYCCASQKI